MPTARACPDLAEYQRLASGQLSSAAVEDLLGHLESCAACAQRLEGLADKDALVDLLRQAQSKSGGPPSEVVTRLVERIRALRPGAPAAPRAADADRIQVVCPGCGKSMKVKAALAGKKGKCPQCQGMVTVPPASPPAVDERTLPPQAPDARTIAPVGPAVSAIRRTAEGTAVPEGDGAADQGLFDFLAPAQAPDEIGRLGPYRVLKVLGVGGMGVVFKAEDPGLQRPVALKAMLPGLASSGAAKQRFLREARAAAALKHDHIVTIHQVGEDRGAPFLAMEFLEGEPLDKRLDHEGKPPLAEVLRIGREIADGLHAAHERGLTHRDIKPANVWLEGKRARVKILDFGLARGSADDAQLTQQGAIVGTPAYMAPEQAQGKSIGPRCDLFSLGCVLYRMATGEPPFRGNDTISTLLAVATENPRPPQELEPALPPALSKLIMSLLAKEPDDRPASAQVVAETLDRIARKPGSPSAPTRTAPPPKRGKPQGRSWRWAAVAGAAVVVVGIGTWLLVATVFKVKVKTSAGEALVVLEIDQPAAEVVVDGTKMTVNVPGDNKPIEIKVDPGQHKLRISKDGFAAVTREIELTVGKSPPIRVALVPLKPPTTENAGGTSIPPPVPALEAMRRENLSPEALAAAGGGDPAKAPKSLVGVLGEPAPVHTAPVVRLAFSPDGHYLASCSHDGTVILWDPMTGRGQRRFQGHTKIVNAVAFKDNRTLISGGLDGTLKLWAVDKDEAVETVKSDIGEVNSASVSPDGSFVAAGSTAGVVKLWKWGQWDRPTTLASYPGRVNTLAFAQDGALVAAGWNEQRPEPSSIRVYKTADGHLAHTLTAHAGGVNTVSISRDGKWLASNGADYTVRMWELSTGKPVALKDTKFDGPSVAFHPDGTMLAAETQGAEFQVLDLPSGTRKERPPSGMAWLPSWGLAFSPDGKLLATGDDVGSVNIYDTATWRVRKEIQQRGHRDLITGVSVSPDGRTILTGGHDHTIRCWDLERPRDNQILESAASSAHCSPVSSPDGKSFVVLNTFAESVVYDATGKRLFPLQLGGVHACAYSTDGKTLAVACYDGMIRLLDVADKKEVFKLTGGGHLAYRPDGKYLAVANDTRTVKVWNVDSGTEQKPLEDAADAAGVWNVAFSPNGKLLACGLQDGSITLWDFVTRAKLRTWRGHSRRADCMKFTPDSRALVSSAGDGTVRLWSTEANRAREVISIGPPDHPLACDLDPSGKYAFVVGHSPVIFVLRLPPSAVPGSQ
jgi:WD40 repeat protein/serine/threonine protein kinase